jgi:hypothetical protein
VRSITHIWTNDGKLKSSRVESLDLPTQNLVLVGAFSRRKQAEKESVLNPQFRKRVSRQDITSVEAIVDADADRLQVSCLEISSIHFFLDKLKAASLQCVCTNGNKLSLFKIYLIILKSVLSKFDCYINQIISGFQQLIVFYVLIIISL